MQNPKIGTIKTIEGRGRYSLHEWSFLVDLAPFKLDPAPRIGDRVHFRCGAPPVQGVSFPYAVRLEVTK